MEGNWNYFMNQFLKTFKMQGNEKQWPTLNMSQCHVPPFPLYALSPLFYCGLSETQKLRASLVPSTLNPLPTSQFYTDLFWWKSQSYLMNILNVKSILQRWPISLSTYVCVCLSVCAVLHGLWEPSSLTRGGIQALSSESAESSSLDCHQTQLELNLDV